MCTAGIKRVLSLGKRYLRFCMGCLISFGKIYIVNFELFLTKQWKEKSDTFAEKRLEPQFPRKLTRMRLNNALSYLDVINFIKFHNTNSQILLKWLHKPNFGLG